MAIDEENYLVSLIYIVKLLQWEILRLFGFHVLMFYAEFIPV